jgi:hypothetical protein
VQWSNDSIQEGGIEAVHKMQQQWKAFFLDQHCMTHILCVEDDCTGALNYELTKWLQDRVIYAWDSIDSVVLSSAQWWMDLSHTRVHHNGCQSFAKQTMWAQEW